MTAEPGLLTDDELVKVMLDAWCEWSAKSELSMMHHILARIRRPLEARGIGLAVEHIRNQQSGAWSNDSIVHELNALARQHTEEGK